MNRLARVQRLWMGRRLAFLGGSAAATAAAFGLHAARLRLDPNGAAVHGVALFVTLIVLAILLRLIRLQMAGPGLEAPSWERHAHRASLREAPLVAFAGTAVAAFLALATPGLVGEERSAASSQIAVQISAPEAQPEPQPEPAPIVRDEPPVAEVVVAAPPVESKPKAPPRRGPEAVKASDPAPIKFFRPVEVNFQDRWVDGEQEENPQDPIQEQIDPTQPSRDAFLRREPEEPRLPPIHFSVGVLLATAQGNLDLEGSVGRFDVDLASVRGEQTFEMGVDLTAEFALTPESALKLMYAGMGIFQRGRHSEDTTYGSATALEGDRYEFEMRWSHLYMALSKRLTAHSRDSVFELSVHVGAMVDHTLTEFESESAGVGAQSEDGERGWVAPGAGFSLSIRGPASAGFVLEVVQSAPVNIGGQSIALTDLRAGLTADLSDGASLFLGYRYVRAVYRVFEDLLVREGGHTAADLAVRGPVLGIDFRF